MSKVLPVAISALIDNNRILLIKRAKGDFVGLWGLPGGKIELNEHLDSAARREIREETNIETEFKDLCGTVSEHLIENNEIKEHFLLFVCRLYPKNNNFKETKEGNLKWFDLNELDNSKNMLIPSDYYMIKNLILKKDCSHYNSVIEKKKDQHFLRKFEGVGL